MMKRRWIVGWIGVAWLLVSQVMANEELWKQVEEAREKDQPKTEIELLGQIEEAAFEGEAWAEGVRAMAQRIATEARIEGRAVVIKNLDEAIDGAPDQAQPLLRALSASWLLGYYQQNRWRFMQRSSTAAPVGDDFESWDLARILEEIDQRFQAALEDDEELKAAAIGGFAMLLEKGSLDDEHRPTLFDFLANEALGFYAMEEVAVSRPIDPFEIAADSPVLAGVEEFLAWQPQTDDETSPKFRALRLHQRLLGFHRGDDDPLAFLTADLQRLRWAIRAAGEEGREERADRALRAFIERHGESPLSAWARVDLGQRLVADEREKDAHDVWLAGAEAFPEHPFGKLCRNQVENLELPVINLTVEDHWTPAGEEVRVAHRNLGRVWFRLYSTGFKPSLETLSRDPLPDREKWLPAMLEGEPVRAWNEELVDEGLFKMREAVLPVPDDLPDGYHVLVASADEGFSMEDNAVAVCGVHITPLAMTVSQGLEGDGLEGFVVDALGGAPLEGIDVGIWIRDGRELTERSTRTNAEGRFEFDGTTRGSCLVMARRGVQRAVVRSWLGVRSGRSARDHEQVIFFTDRSIYRPGQTVHFKGIRFVTNPSVGKYQVLAGKDGEVVLNDPNGEVVERLRVSTNERGSFSGSFTAPDGSVLGRCQLRIEGIHGIGGQVQVEEYKRPKFFTEIDPPAAEVSLGDEVAVKVRAEAYTGAAVDGAKVAWRVTRGAQLPPWTRWCWWIPPFSSNSEEIAHDVAETAADGSVEIRFTAKPDPSVDPELEPVFVYEVTADVTDGAGETRSKTRTIRVARTSLTARLDSNEWLPAGEKIEIGVRTESHDGEGRPAEGVLKVHRLKEPEVCPRPESNHGNWRHSGGEDPSDRWEPGEVVAEFEVTTDEDGEATVEVELDAGAYRLVFTTRDNRGNEVKALGGIQVVDPEGDDFPTMNPFHVVLVNESVEAGGTAVLLWGSGHGEARARVEWFRDGELLRREWSDAGRTQQRFEMGIDDRSRGGITVVVHQVALNRVHRFQQQVEVPWTDKQLTLRWERLVSKLEPGARESWTAVIEGPDGEGVAAEMVATLYDASLDAFLGHGYRDLMDFLRRESGSYRNDRFSSAPTGLSEQSRFDSPEGYSLGQPFRHYRPELAILAGGRFWGNDAVYFGRRSARGGVLPAEELGIAADAFAASAEAAPAPAMMVEGGGVLAEMKSDTGGEVGAPPAPQPDLDQVSLRENLNETAFFYPDLTSEADGKVRISFTMPEALTTWRFLGMAHDADFRSGLLEGETVTAKDLMVQPNPPRFLREGDAIEFTVKVTNQADEAKSGVARLTLNDAATEEDRTAALGIEVPEQAFEVPGRESRTLSWRIEVPDGAGFLQYKAVASSGDLSDGEVGWLPVIPRRILVTESMSLPIRDAGSRDFEFTKLLESGASETLENQFVHVQVVSQPAWYAVMALPYLMEFPHECAEQTFNRYYANALARHIATSDPKIRRIFELWRQDGEALDSSLMKNQDLKGILLEETPWLAEAKSESAARRRVGLLFEDNTMERELEKALAKLGGMQFGDGMWPWFPGGRRSEYITLYITTGFGRLRALGVATDITPALRALVPLDAELTRRYEDIREDGKLDEDHLTPWVAHYLYTRSFFLRDRQVGSGDQAAFDYFVGQAKKYWTSLGSRMSRAHAALALHRLDEGETAGLITRSLKEHAKVTEEQGMFWKDSEGEGWWWWQAPIETQAMMIEAFREIDGDEEAVDDCQVWLIKQKQVGDWRTTKATADAVHALLLGGRNLLSSDELLEVSLGGVEVEPGKVEAGTGMYEVRFARDEVKPELGDIELRKEDDGVAWASIHWQYLEDMAKVTAHEGGQLRLDKELFLRRNTDEGPVLVSIDDHEVAVGDELVTRVVVRNDRAMEFIHLKDLRGSGTEPVNVLSGYRWQDGVDYYEVTRDTATHFFIDRLPPGTHVFETSVRVQHAGAYQTGIAEIRCMYAPEFAAHSGSVGIEVE